MINRISQSGFNAGMQAIRVAIINKLAQISSFMSDISTVLGVSVHWIDSLAQTLAQSLSAINAKLVEKGSTAAADYSEIAGKIDAIALPSGTLSITANGTTDVTDYAGVDVNVPAYTSKRVWTSDQAYSMNANDVVHMLLSDVPNGTLSIITNLSAENEFINQGLVAIYYYKGVQNRKNMLIRYNRSPNGYSAYVDFTYNALIPSGQKYQIITYPYYEETVI